MIIFCTCADMEMETRQPAVVQTAGCCVSIEDGNYREWAGELVCRLEGLCRRASVLTGWRCPLHVPCACDSTIITVPIDSVLGWLLLKQLLIIMDTVGSSRRQQQQPGAVVSA